MQTWNAHAGKSGRKIPIQRLGPAKGTLWRSWSRLNFKSAFSPDWLRPRGTMAENSRQISGVRCFGMPALYKMPVQTCYVAVIVYLCTLYTYTPWLRQSIQASLILCSRLLAIFVLTAIYMPWPRQTYNQT